MTGILLWVRQYARGCVHVAEQGDAFTLCGLGLRDSVIWGEEYDGEREVPDECPTCSHLAGV